MSFILDALKKSENERQRQIGPSLADVQIRRARVDRPWWAVGVAALLLVNLGVLVVVLWRDRSPTTITQAPAPQTLTVAAQAPPQPAPPTSNQAPAGNAMSAPVHMSPAVQSLAEVAGTEADALDGEPAYDPSIEEAARVPEGPPVVQQINGPAVSPLASEPTFAARDRAGSVAPPDGMLPTHGSLIATGTNLPDMRLDIHVYSPNPQDRFVFVNMRKYTEGQALSEGPTLERITPDGAIMNLNGTRFLLPRQ